MPDADDSSALDKNLDSVVDRRLLELLRCPEKKEPLMVASKTLVAKINASIDKGQLSDRGGETVSEPTQAALIRKDGQVAYLIRDHIPELRIGRGIDLAQLGPGVAGSAR